MNTNKTIEEDFNELFYEGERNSTYCKKHKVLATPHEVKEFAIFEVEKATLKALPVIKNAIYEEMKEMVKGMQAMAVVSPNTSIQEGLISKEALLEALTKQQ